MELNRRRYNNNEILKQGIEEFSILRNVLISKYGGGTSERYTHDDSVQSANRSTQQDRQRH